MVEWNIAINQNSHNCIHNSINQQMVAIYASNYTNGYLFIYLDIFSCSLSLHLKQINRERVEKVLHLNSNDLLARGSGGVAC